MKELFSIGDAADFVGITRRIILNYEAHGLVFRIKKKTHPAIVTIPLIH